MIEIAATQHLADDGTQERTHDDAPRHEEQTDKGTGYATAIAILRTSAVLAAQHGGDVVEYLEHNDQHQPSDELTGGIDGLTGEMKYQNAGIGEGHTGKHRDNASYHAQHGTEHSGNDYQHFHRLTLLNVME
jgi:hypothetical protein